MRNSLQDQLLKAGLTNKHKAAKARKAVAHQQKQKDRGQLQETEAERQAREGREQKAERDRALNAQREAQKSERERLAQGRNIVDHAAQALQAGETPFHVTHGTTVKTLQLDAAQHRHLMRGLLAVALGGDDALCLIPAAAAEKLQQRCPELLLSWARGEDDTPDEDDPYAAYQIPDDLMW